MKPLLQQLAKSPWIARQIAKGATVAGAATAGVLSQAQIVVNGQTVDLIPAQTEVAIVAFVVAAIAGTAEVLASYAAAKFGGSN